MDIYGFKEGILKKQDSIIDAFDLEIQKHKIISVVGGGGKTSLIFALAYEFSKSGKKVIVTATTKMYEREDMCLFCQKEKIIKSLNENKFAFVGKMAEKGKITADFDDIDSILDLCDILLIESDGSHHLPFKVPNENEPVIYPKTDVVIGVCGLSSLGKEIKYVCHRKEEAVNVLGKNESDVIDEKDISFILSSTLGQMKNVNCEYRFFISQMGMAGYENGRNIAFDLYNKGLKGSFGELKE